METETKRIRDIVERKIDAVIKFRHETIKHKARRIESVFERLKQDIIFLIDNPNYVHLSAQAGKA
jgi:hypothetical protein